MNQDERMGEVIARIENHLPLKEVVLDPELSAADSFLKILRVKCFNWTNERITKVHALRFDVNLPPIETLNMIVYPDQHYDAPIFLFFFFISKRKVICHFNVNCPFDDADYLAKWVDPISGIMNKYPPFEVMDRYPEWMKKYQQKDTVYGLFEKGRLEDLTNASFDVLDFYLPLLAECEKVTDPDRLKRIADFHDKFRDDIRTQDKAQGMMSKFIGKKKAHRIFYEVTT